jgi:hypothetical protein
MAKAQDQAQAFLRDLLVAGPLAANTVRAQAEEAGFAWATIRRAKHQLGVEVVRESIGGTGDGRWLWSLPKEQDAQSQGPAPPQVAQAQVTPLQAVQTVQPPTAQPLPRPQRVITVRRLPQGPNEISFEVWESLGREVGSDCPRIKQYLREREAHLLPRECSPATL